MIRRLEWFRSFSERSGSLKKLPDAKLRPAKVKPEAMLDTVHEVAIYIHRFHNLDLFQQGWYQIKITLQREDGTSAATPARVVQYEVAAPSPGSDAAVYALWRIDNKDNSFSTQPFRIKYARQDVPFFIMVAFHLPLKKNEGPSSAAVIMKFELLFAEIWENGSEFQASIGSCPAAIHEFRIPPKALLGLHSYCPVHFDAFHSVLVDVTVHISLLKANKASPRVSSVSLTATEDVAAGESVLVSNQDQEQEADSKHILLVKALLSAHNILLEELHRIGNGIGKVVDLAEFESKMNNMNILLLKLGIVDSEASGQAKPQNGLERRSVSLDFKYDSCLQKSSKNDVFKMFHLLGDQVLFLWNIMLKFHRENKIKILEYLCDEWAKERRAEWSIWMVYSKVEMPHHYINGGFESHHVVCKKGSTLWKLTDDPAQLAAMRADLHRRSIAQMRMNNRSIQDMNIFRDPLKVPIVIVERVMNAPRRTFSHNSYLRNLDLIDTTYLLTRATSEVGKKQSTSAAPQNGRDLKIAVFVHGFQGHHLDLRLVRNQWLLIDPKIQFLMSEVNEDKTSGDFREMGLRLAQEVVSFIEKKTKKLLRSGRLRDIKLSFVGHSIGNIILRTALADSVMEPYLKYLYTYVSVSGPHLGYLYSSNSLFNSGLWLLKKLKGTQCIHQLTFTDNPDLRNTFFYKLCKRTTLENFKHIILLCSPQDGYVPYHSARIETCRAASMDNSKKGKVFLEMLNNCLDQIRRPTSENRVFMRCDVSFDTTAYGRNLNTLIGRAAHIEFLETDIFARFIMWSFPDLFR